MSLSSVFNIAGSGMSAQTTRLNTVASNIANADTVSSSIDQTYRARHPVFATVFQGAQGSSGDSLFQNQDAGGFSAEIGRQRWNVAAPNVLGVFPAVARQVLRGDVAEGQRNQQQQEIRGLETEHGGNEE